MTGHFATLTGVVLILSSVISAFAADRKPTAQTHSSPTSLAALIRDLQQRAKTLGNSQGMRRGYESLKSSYQLQPADVKYSDFVMARLLFEATRDAGFWNLRWAITDREPVSDQIWKAWKSARIASLSEPTATAECDELSALYSFLAERAGVHSIGLFWPTFNHTVAVWEIKPANGKAVRVVVPTTQIFLDESEMFGTRKFNPWRQKTIHEYVRHDIGDSFEVPKPLFDFFLIQVDKYAGATDGTLQRIRYLRDGVFRHEWTPEAAAREALGKRQELKSGPAEDLAALQNFALDMRSGLLR